MRSESRKTILLADNNGYASLNRKKDLEMSGYNGDASLLVDNNSASSLNRKKDFEMSGYNEDASLLVDNNSAASLNRKKDLERFGYKVIPVYSSEQVLKAVDKISGIDLVLMDFYAGTGMDGTQVAKGILKDHDLPVVFIIPNADPQIIKKIESTTSYGFVTRNSSTAEVNSSIKMALRLFEANETTRIELAERKRAEKELIFQNVLMQTQLEVSLDGILIVDENDKIISFNQRFADIWGIPDSIMSMQSSEKALEYVLPKLTDPDEFAKRIHNLYENKQEKSYEEIALRDGKILERYSSPMFGSNDEYYGRIWYYRDITERKRAENQIKERNKELNAFYKLSEIVERKSSLEEIYQEFTAMIPGSLQYTEIACARTVIYKRAYFTENFKETAWMQSVPIYVNKVEVGKIEVGYLENIFDGSETPFLSEERQLLNALAERLGRITEFKQSKEALIKHQNLLKETQRITGVGGWEFNPATQKIFWTDEVYRIYGVSKDYDPSNVEQDIQFYAPSGQEKIDHAFRQLIESGTPFDLELQFITAQGQQKWVRTVGRAEYDNGNITRAFGNIMDITDRKLAENQIRRNLEEKNVLLAEIHHRVKNNMAVISSLLELQTEFVDLQEGTENLLLDTKNRIQSMAMIHELVYKTSDFAEIRADKLMQRLAGYLEQIYRTQDKDLSIQVHSDHIMLDVNTSVPLTLLANEVISNAFKHAFTDRKSGSIEVLFEKEKEGYRFVVADNGKGVPDHGQINNPKSLGSTIIHGLARQLQGQLEFSTPPDGGLKVTLWFPGNTKS